MRYFTLFPLGVYTLRHLANAYCLKSFSQPPSPFSYFFLLSLRLVFSNISTLVSFHTHTNTEREYFWWSFSDRPSNSPSPFQRRPEKADKCLAFLLLSSVCSCICVIFVSSSVCQVTRSNGTHIRLVKPLMCFMQVVCLAFFVHH